MEKYAVAVLNKFENVNTVQIVEAENEIEAIGKAVNEFNNKEDISSQDFVSGFTFNKDEEGTEISQFINYLFEDGINVSEPVKL